MPLPLVSRMLGEAWQTSCGDRNAPLRQSRQYAQLLQLLQPANRTLGASWRECCNGKSRIPRPRRCGATIGEMLACMGLDELMWRQGRVTEVNQMRRHGLKVDRSIASTEEDR